MSTREDLERASLSEAFRILADRIDRLEAKIDELAETKLDVARLREHELAINRHSLDEQE